MKSKTVTAIILFISIFLYSASVNAVQVFRCLGKKIEKGDSTYSVLKECGEPAYQEILSNEGCDKVEKWHYDCYERKYVVELTFIKGKLENQSRGDVTQGAQSCNQ